MATGDDLSLISERLVPGYLASFNWYDIWRRPLAEGKAFEWSVLAGLVAGLRSAGWQCIFAPLQYRLGREWFILQNAIPRHHGAQPGHTRAFETTIPLEERFLCALTPKVVINRGGTYFSIFREGCPYHSIGTGLRYEDRPDIFILQGTPTQGFPTTEAEIMRFSFDYPGQQIMGSLRVVNSNQIPLIERIPPENVDVLGRGIIECSVNKPSHIANAQLKRYKQIFNIVPLFLVTGNEATSTEAPGAVVDLTHRDLVRLENDMRSATAAAVRHFGLL